MLYACLDLSRRPLDFHLLDEQGERVEVGAAPPDADGLATLARRVARHGQPLRAAIESMTRARFVHDQLELRGWEVEIADALRVKGLAPLACKTDRMDGLGARRALPPRARAGGSGCPIRTSVPSASAPVGVCISSATARA
jgi:hypothetical protein